MYSPPKDTVTLNEVEVWVGEEILASIRPSQNDDIMVEHVEGETPSEVLFEV